MPSHFDLLNPLWTYLVEDALHAERRALIEPRTSAF
jgi:hypothetical protein